MMTSEVEEFTYDNSKYMRVGCAVDGFPALMLYFTEKPLNGFDLIGVELLSLKERIAKGFRLNGVEDWDIEEVTDNIISVLGDKYNDSLNFAITDWEGDSEHSLQSIIECNAAPYELSNIAIT